MLLFTECADVKAQILQSMHRNIEAHLKSDAFLPTFY